MAHGEQYAAEFGWDTSFEALVARIVADYAADHDPAPRGGVDRRARRAAGGLRVLRRGERRRDRPAADPAGHARGRAGWGWGGGWSTARSSSPARRATAGWCCGPTTARRRAADLPGARASDWSTKNATTASAPNSSGRTTCSRSDGRIPRRSRRGGKRAHSSAVNSTVCSGDRELRTRITAWSNCTSTQPECAQALLLRQDSADPSSLITTDSRALETATHCRRSGSRRPVVRASANTDSALVRVE